MQKRTFYQFIYPLIAHTLPKVGINYIIYFKLDRYETRPLLSVVEWTGVELCFATASPQMLMAHNCLFSDWITLHGKILFLYFHWPELIRLVPLTLDGIVIHWDTCPGLGLTLGSVIVLARRQFPCT